MRASWLKRKEKRQELTRSAVTKKLLRDARRGASADILESDTGKFFHPLQMYLRLLWHRQRWQRVLVEGASWPLWALNSIIPFKRNFRLVSGRPGSGTTGYIENKCTTANRSIFTFWWLSRWSRRAEPWSSLSRFQPKQRIQVTPSS